MLSFKPAYTYRNIEFYSKNSPVDSIIGSMMPGSLIEPGNDYWVKEMEDERKRIKFDPEK